MMKGSGSALFRDTEGYRANLPGVVDFVAPRMSDFSARLTWIELADLRLLHSRETIPRVAYVSLPAEFVFVTFPTHRAAALLCDGNQLELGDIVVHSLGQRLHQRTTAATAWGLIALTPSSLQAHAKTLTGFNIAIQPFGQILRARPSDVRCLLRLHAEAIRIAETKLNNIRHAEVVRALQQEIIWALAGCLADAEHHSISMVMRRNVSVVALFEDALLVDPDRRPSVPQVCKAIEVSERRLKRCCLSVLGMSPAPYLRLRYLERARLALLHASHITAGEAADMTQRYGFASPLHFVRAYHNAFGVLPRIRHGSGYCKEDARAFGAAISDSA
jgi:AraC-like DNA-binding protein